MKLSNGKKVRTGIFVLVGLGLFIAAIFLIGQQKNMFSSTFTVYANFKNVSGLQVGNYVRFAGINSGTVNNIRILNDSTVSVELILQKEIQPYIKLDSKASIGSDGLMGDKLVQITPGTDLFRQAKDGDPVVAVNPLEIDKIMDKLGGMAESASAIGTNLAGILYKVNSGQGSIGRLINDDGIANKLESTVESARETVKTVNKAAKGASENMEAAKSNFLLRGYFKKKERKRIQDSTDRANGKTPKDDKKK